MGEAAAKKPGKTAPKSNLDLRLDLDVSDSSTTPVMQMNLGTSLMPNSPNKAVGTQVQRMSFYFAYFDYFDYETVGFTGLHNNETRRVGIERIERMWYANLVPLHSFLSSLLDFNGHHRIHTRQQRKRRSQRSQDCQQKHAGGNIDARICGHRFAAGGEYNARHFGSRLRRFNSKHQFRHRRQRSPRQNQPTTFCR